MVEKRSKNYAGARRDTSSVDPGHGGKKFSRVVA
jgi:hypothetical protein